MNNVLEEAMEKKKELWIGFQDMKKAFDSVSLVALTKAMKRVRIPEEIIKFTLNLFEGREISIITEYGNTRPF